MDALLAEGVTVRYGARTAVQNVDVRVARGQAVALIGANGAGKTSLIEGCLGLRRLSGGHVLVSGQPVEQALRDGRVGVMLQQGGVPGTARSAEWLRHVGRLFATLSRVNAVMDELGIDPHSKTPFKRLSGGEQQRVRLGSALLARSELLVLDEPTTGLDPVMRQRILDVVAHRRDDGTGVLLTTHRLDEIDTLFTEADQVLVMAQGSVTQRGSVHELLGSGEAIRLVLPAEAAISLDHLLALQQRLQAADPAAAGSSAVGSPVHGVRIEGPVVTARGQELTARCAASPAALTAVMSWCSEWGWVPLEVRTDARSLNHLVEDAGAPPGHSGEKPSAP